MNYFSPEPERRAPPKPMELPTHQSQRTNQWQPSQKQQQQSVIPDEYLLPSSISQHQHQQQQFRRPPPPPPQLQKEPSFVFPLTRHVLWDTTTRGATRTLSSETFLPTFVVQPEPILRLSQKLLSTTSTWFERSQIGWLISRRVSVSELRVERFDPNLSPSILLDGDIPIRVFTNEESVSINSTTDSDFLKEYQNSSLPLTVRVVSSIANTNNLNLHCCALCSNIILSISPVYSPRFLQTPFSESLFRMNPISSTRINGFLSLDQSRKVVLLSNTDSRISSIPLVGIWLMRNSLDSPQSIDYAVWSLCCKFLSNPTIKDRVLVSGAFLIALLSPTSSSDAVFFQTTFSNNSPSSWKSFDTTINIDISSPSQIFPLSSKFISSVATSQRTSQQQHFQSQSQQSLSPSLPNQIPQQQKPIEQTVQAMSGFDVAMLQPIIQPLLSQIHNLQNQLASVTQELARQQELISSSLRRTNNNVGGGVSVGVNTSSSSSKPLSRSMLKPETHDVGIGTSPNRNAFKDVAVSPMRYNNCNDNQQVDIMTNSFIEPNNIPTTSTTSSTSIGVFHFTTENSPSTHGGAFITQQQTSPFVDNSRLRRPFVIGKQQQGQRRQTQQQKQTQQPQQTQQTQLYEFNEGDSHIMMPSFLDES